MMRILLTSAVLALGLAGTAQAATTLFADDFNASTQGLNTAPSGWTVSNGTVDVIGTGFFEFYPGNGNYIDMDGSTNNAGRIDTITTFNAIAGTSYTITFDYGSNGGGNELLTFGFGGWSGSLPINGFIASLTSYTVAFTALTSGFSTLFFEAAGGDLHGPVLDNVSLAIASPSTVPVPAAGLLLLGALGGLGALRRRKAI